jgi:hypothetical protein
LNRPFDDVYYQTLLKGLEISELPFKVAMHDNKVHRFDAQYFSKSALEIEQHIKKGHWDELFTLSSKIASFGAYALTNQFSYQEEGVPFLRCLNIRNGFTDFSDALFISSKANTLLSKSEVREGMVLLTMSGTVGNSTVALPTWDYPINSNQDIAKITPKQGVSPYYLVAFFGSKYGAIQMSRLPVGSVQQHIFLWMIERLAISRLSIAAERKISDCVLAAYDAEEMAKQQMSEAEATLLHALSLDTAPVNSDLSYEKSSRNVLAAQRFDAEYFSPRVSALLTRLGRDGVTIGDVAPPRHERFIPSSAGNFDYIEISGVQADGTVVSDHIPCIEAPSRASQFVREGDVVTSTVRPIRRLSALITKGQSGHVCSSGFVVLQPVKLASEVLLTYLRLAPVCELMGLHTSASLYPAISERDLLKIPIPHFDTATATKVITAVRAAHASRRRATRLLAAAKVGVEMALELTEATALQFIDEHLGMA